MTVLSPRVHFVVVSRLQKVNAIASDQVNQSMLLCNGPRPRARQQVLQWFRLTDSIERLVQRHLNHPDLAGLRTRLTTNGTTVSAASA